MPSTVKVRIKAARNLSSLTPASSAAATAASSGTTTSSTVISSHKNISPRSSSLLSSANNNNNSPSVLLPDTHVTITLGGHSAVAEYDEDNDYNY